MTATRANSRSPTPLRRKTKPTDAKASTRDNNASFLTFDLSLSCGCHDVMERRVSWWHEEVQGGTTEPPGTLRQSMQVRVVPRLRRSAPGRFESRWGRRSPRTYRDRRDDAVGWLRRDLAPPYPRRSRRARCIPRRANIADCAQASTARPDRRTQPGSKASRCTREGTKGRGPRLAFLPVAAEWSRMTPTRP